MNDWWMTDELTEHIWLLMLGLIVILSFFTALNVVIIERAISSWNICCCSCTALLFKPSSSILIYDRLIGDREIADWCHLVTSALIQSLKILLLFSRLSFVIPLCRWQAILRIRKDRSLRSRSSCHITVVIASPLASERFRWKREPTRFRLTSSVLSRTRKTFSIVWKRKKKISCRSAQDTFAIVYNIAIAILIEVTILSWDRGFL